MPSALLENLLLHGKKAVPAFLYGTAWQKDKTADTIYQAICSGYKGVYTGALSNKGYSEYLVGEGIRRALNEAKISRDDFFIQTTVGEQELNIVRYNPTRSITEQVHASVRTSLMNLRPSAKKSSSESTVIDCLVQHIAKFVPHNGANTRGLARS